MKKTNKFLPMMLACVMVLGLMTPVSMAAEITFEDVPATHWAYADIAAMSEQGVVKGVGDNRFEPGMSVAITQFATMLERSFYAEDLDNAAAGDFWWTSAMDVALAKGLLANTTGEGDFADNQWNQQNVEAPLTRYDMAQVMYNLLKDQGFEFPSETPVIPDAASIPEKYKDAVNAMYALGLLKGTDSAGNFNGTQTMDRAQACAVMHRLIEAIMEWLKNHGNKPVEPTPTPTPAVTPTPTPTPSAPADLELINKGESTGIDPQKPVESAPPISEVEIPSGMGLQIGRSDEGLIVAGTERESGNAVWVTESEKYVQLSDEVTGKLTSRYSEGDVWNAGYCRISNIAIALYVGDSITLDLQDFGYDPNEYIWHLESDSYVTATDIGNGKYTLKANAPVVSDYVGSTGKAAESPADRTSVEVTVYEKKPSSWDANFHIATDYEPVYYTNGEYGVWWATKKGTQFDGSNGVPAKSEFGLNADFIRIYPDSSLNIPASDMENGYIKDEAVEKYFDFSCILNEHTNRYIHVGPNGGIGTPNVDFTSSARDHKATIVVTSKKDGRSCSIDVACKYYEP